MRRWWKKMVKKMKRWGSPQELFAAAKADYYPREKMQEPKRQTRYNYTQGPMYYLGQQIVKGMQDAGYPAKILWCYRSPEIQAGLYAKGRTKAGRRVTNAKPWSSAHQYYEAVDIIHPTLAWKVTDAYWETLATVVKITAEKFGVEMTHGHYWKRPDSAHIQLKDWKKQRAKLYEIYQKNRTPNTQELWKRFEEVLPQVARQYDKFGLVDGHIPKGMVDLVSESKDMLKGVYKANPSDQAKWRQTAIDVKRGIEKLLNIKNY